jgi:hypothetical protein
MPIWNGSTIISVSRSPKTLFKASSADRIPDHCIETLRISIMCQADLSLYTFTWRTAHDNRPKSKSDSKRQCVNWNDIEAWSMARRVSLWPRLIRKGGREDTIHL